MTQENLENLKYPNGRFSLPKDISKEDRQVWIDQIKILPSKFCATAENLSQDQLNTPYREGGWTVRQVVHHVPDSHLNSYVRFKWAMTEDEPMIKPYKEKEWSKLHDAKTMDIDISLNLLTAVHARWMYFVESLSDSDFKKMYNHPDWKNPLSIESTLAIYAWHGDHHLAHINNLKERKKW